MSNNLICFILALIILIIVLPKIIVIEIIRWLRKDSFIMGKKEGKNYEFVLGCFILIFTIIAVALFLKWTGL